MQHFYRSGLLSGSGKSHTDRDGRKDRRRRIHKISVCRSDRDHLYFFGAAPLVLIAILAVLERFLNKHLPDVIKPLFTPLICLAAMVPLTIVVVGPVIQGFPMQLRQDIMFYMLWRLLLQEL